MSTLKFDNSADKELLAEVVKLLMNYDKNEPYVTNTAKRIIWKVEEWRGKL